MVFKKFAKCRKDSFIRQGRQNMNNSEKVLARLMNPSTTNERACFQRCGAILQMVDELVNDFL